MQPTVSNWNQPASSDFFGHPLYSLQIPIIDQIPLSDPLHPPTTPDTFFTPSPTSHHRYLLRRSSSPCRVEPPFQQDPRRLPLRHGRLSPGPAVSLTPLHPHRCGDLHLRSVRDDRPQRARHRRTHVRSLRELWKHGTRGLPVLAPPPMLWLTLSPTFSIGILWYCLFLARFA